jgi:flavin-dependent dehydrogenase
MSSSDERDRHDVLIVGGGPAGSTCAQRLVRAGLDVVVIDRARFPRDKVCAGWITPNVVRALNLDLEDYARTNTLQPFTGFRTGRIGGRSRLTDFRRVVSYGIRRCEFDDYLLRCSGVATIQGEPVTVIRRDGGLWIVNGRIRARMIVGAGGHFCPVARLLNPDHTDHGTIAAQEVEFPLDAADAAICPIEGEQPELLFWPDSAGYAWCVRKGAFLNIGAGRLAPLALPPAMREFRAVLDRRGIPQPGAPIRWKGHAYLLNRFARRRLVADGVVLIGDAAGLALAPSGEGILTAVESGQLAAETIIAAAGNYSAPRLSAYAHHAAQRFGRRLGSTPTMPRWLAAAASTVALAVPWVTRHVVLERGFLHLRRRSLDGASQA